jgi:two-component system CheB/CheR fusion protein
MHSQSAGPLCVLAVDDNRDAADSLGLLLSLWGHRPLVAYDAAGAWAAALGARPDVVVLDLRLPDMSGWDLARRLRAEPALNGVKLIAVTGCDRDADRSRSEAAGIDWHLIKPVEPELLRQVLTVCGLRRRRA